MSTRTKLSLLSRDLLQPAEVEASKKTYTCDYESHNGEGQYSQTRQRKWFQRLRHGLQIDAHVLGVALTTL